MFERLIGRAAIAAGTLTRSEIEKKALSFARRLPPNKFTPAQAQSFLQNCRGDADKALAEIGTIMEETISANPMRAPSRAESMRSDYSPDSSE
jgi:chaperone BCS1